MKEKLVFNVPGSHGVDDLTLTVHAPTVELTDNAGNTITIAASQLDQLSSRLEDIGYFYETGKRDDG